MSKTVSKAEFLARLKTVNNDVALVGEFNGCRQYARFKHKTCGTKWTASAYNVLRGKGCPFCGKKKADGKQLELPSREFSKQLKVLLPNMKLVSPYLGRNHLVTLRDTGSGQLIKDFPRNLLRKHKTRKLGSSRLKLSQTVHGYVQGYEPQAIEYIVSTGLAEANDLEVTGIPSIRYTKSGKIHLYRPDILVKSQHRLIEVKSLATLGLLGDYYYRTGKQLLSELKAKRRGCIAAGYKFTLMLMQGDGSRIKLPKNWHELTLTQLKEIALPIGQQLRAET